MDACGNLRIGEMEVFADGEGGEGIIDIEFAGDLSLDF